MKIDNDLIFIYAENTRTKLKNISKDLGKSIQRIEYNINSMEKSSLVNNPYTIVDYSKLGVLLFRVYFKGAYLTEIEKTKTIDILIKNKYVMAIQELMGEYDLVVEIGVPNPSRFNKVLLELSNLMPNLRYNEVFLNVFTNLFPRRYLSDKNDLIFKVKNKIIIGGDKDKYKLNKKEFKVLKSLVNKPRIKYTKMAEECSMNAHTCKLAKTSLEKNEIIKGYKCIIDRNKMKILRFRVFIKFLKVQKKQETELIDFVLKTKGALHLHRMIGEWDMELDFESKDRQSIRKITIQIRENFKEIIDDFKIIEVYKYHFRKYVPGYLLNENND